MVVIGGGAAGLMAGAYAAEVGLRCVVLERRHRPGLKLLLCGNNRCNVTHEASVEELLAAYGDPVGGFLRAAISAFPPAALRRWFADHGLRTTAHEDGRVFPVSEQADDVVHCFRDVLRDREIPLVQNCPVLGVEPETGGYRVRSTHFSLLAPHVLVATGGVSYPKTGSVGDGQRFARDLGHRVAPYRPGLAGLELDICGVAQRQSVSLPGTVVAICCGGAEVARTSGEILLDRSCARGPAMVNASRIMARENLRDVELRIDLFPRDSVADLARRLAAGQRQRRGGAGAGRSPACRGGRGHRPVAASQRQRRGGGAPAQGLADAGPGGAPAQGGDGDRGRRATGGDRSSHHAVAAVSWDLLCGRGDGCGRSHRRLQPACRVRHRPPGCRQYRSCLRPGRPGRQSGWHPGRWRRPPCHGDPGSTAEPSTSAAPQTSLKRPFSVGTSPIRSLVGPL